MNIFNISSGLTVVIQNTTEWFTKAVGYFTDQTHTSRPKVTHYLFQKAVLQNLNQHLAHEDMFTLMQVIQEVAVRGVKKWGGSEQKMYAVLSKRFAAVFGEETCAKLLFQKQLSQLWLKNPKHICLRPIFAHFIDEETCSREYYSGRNSSTENQLITAFRQYTGTFESVKFIGRSITDALVHELALKQVKHLTLIRSQRLTNESIKALQQLKHITSLKITHFSYAFTQLSLNTLPSTLTNVAIDGRRLDTASVSHLVGLKRLSLSSCFGDIDRQQLFQSIPHTIEFLSFASSQLLKNMVLPSFEKFVNLHMLDLSQTRCILDENFRLPDSLVTLNISRCQFARATMRTLLKLPHLKDVSIGESPFVLSKIDVESLPKSLERLDVTAADVNVDFLSHLRSLPLLQEVQLNEVRNFDREMLRAMPSTIQKLGLEFLSLEDPICEELQRFTELRVLNLSNNERINGGSFHLLPKTIEELHLNSCCITKEGLQHISQLPKLVTLHITPKDISKVIIAPCIDTLRHLENSSVQSLCIESCVINQEILEYLPKTVKQLSFIHCKVDEQARTYIKHLAQLDGCKYKILPDFTDDFDDDFYLYDEYLSCISRW